jgi:cytoskeletal protein CcmA (bactofilin family)
MAYTYTRQSSFTDGDTITAAIFNDEYNQLVNAFAYTTVAGTTGHRHDGSTAQGGSIHTIGDLDFLNKIVADSTNNRWGVFVEVGGAAVEQIRIQDGAIVPVTDNDIDLGTSVLEFKNAYFDGTVTSDAFAGPLTGDVTGTADLATSITVSANNSTDETTYPLFVDGATGTQGAESDTGFTYNPSSGLLTIGGELDAASLDISGSADIDGTMEADAYTVDGTALNEYIADTVGAMVSSNTETNITVTYEDGDNTLDFVIGTLNQDTTGTADNITVSANNSTDETVYPIFVDGATGSQGAESDTGLTYNPSSGNLTIGGALTSATLDISGNADIDGTLEADAYTVDGTTLSEYIADTVGAMVTSNTETNITVTYQDADNTLDFVALGTITALNNATENELVTIGSTTTELDAESGLTYDGSTLVVTGDIDLSGDIDVDGTMEADAITLGGVTLAETIADTVGAMVSSNTETNITVTYEDGDNTLDFVIGTLNQDTTGTADLFTASANNSADETVYPVFVDGATGSQGAETDTGLTYNPSTGVITATQFTGAVVGNVTGNASGTAATVTGAAQSAITSLGTLTTLTVDNVIINSTTIGHTSDTDLITLADGVVTVAGELDATTLDISGDADIDGTLEADAITIDGVTLSETIADTVGAMVTSNTETDITVTYDDADNTLDFVVGNISGTAGLATSITASANNSTDETVYPTFVDGATGTQGIETDTGLTYNPSTGVITATQFTGAVVGNVTGNASGTAATVTGGTQASITSAANLVTVGTIGTGVWQGTAIAGGYIANDAIDSQHYTDGSIDNAHIADDAIDSEHYADGSIDNAHLADDAVDTDEIADNAVTLAKMAGLARGKVIYGDSSGNPAALALGTSGYVLKSDGTDIAWAADAGLSTEEVQDIAGGMFTSNTESGITVTYQDGDGTVDFTVGTLNQDTTGTADNITITANDSTDETVYPIFVDGATGSQGAESDTGLTYNPSTGVLTTTSVTGNLTGNVTGNASGTAATVTSATQAAITTLANLTTSGALNAGSITSGFGTIDTGSSAITTTGLISGGSLDIDDVLINGTTIGHTDDTDLITLADGIATVAGEISVTTLDIGGTNVTSTAAELNILDGVTSTAAELNILDGVTSTAAELNILDGVNSTAAELNIMDGGTVASSTTLEDGDRVVVNDNGTMKQVAMTDFDSDRFSIVTSAPVSGSGKRIGHVWYVI